MLNLAILALGLSILWTAFVMFANMMSDATDRSMAPFVGEWSLWACWLVTAGLFLYWMLNDRAVV